MRVFVVILLLLAATPTIGQFAPFPRDPADFPPAPPRTFYQEVLGFRAETERLIKELDPRASNAEAVSALVDTLVARWDVYGDYIDRQYGHLPNTSRDRPYWLITTDDAADTLTDRFGNVLERYVQANPNEKTGQVRIDWEVATAQIGVPVNRIYGFQFVELAKRGALVRRELEAAYPTKRGEACDAYLRFLWDLVQFYRQLRPTWYDRHSLNVSKEDWIVYRIKGLCDSAKWSVGMSFTAISIDTTNIDPATRDPMKDLFMHRLVVVDPACPETVDFLVPLPHFRRMEAELDGRSEAERQRIFERHQQELIQRGMREAGAKR